MMELNKEVLDCMKALRRRLRDEQAADIHLSQPNAVDAMLEGCLKSHDEETRRLGQRLAELSDQPQRVAKPVAEVELPVGNPTGSVRIYRGQRIYA
jgi:type IV secretory pathway ATPase VirB11/archaellum biosynthesis ATPase